VIAPTHPGFGHAALPDWIDSVDDLAYIYLDLLYALDLRDVTVVGTSLGGWLAAEIAAFAGGFSGVPGAKYPNMFVFFAISTPGHTPEEIRDAVHAEIARIQKEDITDEELAMIKTRAKADLIRKLGDNEGLAFELGGAQALYGDWREVFRQVDRIEKVSKADIRRIANTTFVESNRTIGISETTHLAQASAGGKENQ